MVAASQYVPVRPRSSRSTYPLIQAVRLTFWPTIPVYESPATKIASIVWSGSLMSALLHADINLNAGINLDGIYLNGSLLPNSSGSAGAHQDYDVASRLVQGVNTVLIAFSGILIVPWFPNGMVLLYIDITADNIIEAKPPEEPLPWTTILLYGGLAVAGIGVTAYLISALKGRGGVSISMPSYVSRSVTKARKKIGRKISGD